MKSTIVHLRREELRRCRRRRRAVVGLNSDSEQSFLVQHSTVTLRAASHLYHQPPLPEDNCKHLQLCRVVSQR